MFLSRQFEKAKKFIQEWWRAIDRGLFWSIVGVILCGIFLVCSASPMVASARGYEPFYLVKKQLFFLVPSVGVMLITSMMNQRQIRRISFFVFFVFLILTICTLFLGVETKGSRRWIFLAGMSLQPSEFLKPSFAVICAWIFASGRLIQNFPGKLIAGGLFAFVLVFLLAQPDVGMSFTIAGIWAAQLFIAGITLWWIFILACVGILGASGLYFLLPHVQSRINRFFFPDSGDIYQIQQAIKALRTAGWFGEGPGEGKITIPDAHTDVILAIAAEEYGFLLSACLIILFAFIVIRGFYLISREKNLFIMLAVAGLLTQFGMQALINMGSTLDLLPTKGMTLPFISYGGSSLLSIAFGFGVILSLTRRYSGQGD